ncbi:hypothetical protein MTO96_027205 [Rhipicephalus appendiculatus]
MKRSPPTHSPEEGRMPNDDAAAGAPAKKARLKEALKRLLDAGSASNGPAPKVSRNDASPGSGGIAATGTGGLKLSESTIAELREYFELFDRDGDGEISPDDLGVVMRAMGDNLTQTKLEEIIAKADTNGNGTVDFPEFVAMISEPTCTTLPEEVIREAFQVFDQGGKGVITAPDLRYVMTALGVQVTDEEVQEMIREADVDGDGQISYEEFVALDDVD